MDGLCATENSSILAVNVLAVNVSLPLLLYLVSTRILYTLSSLKKRLIHAIY